ncbi:hypothetical protein JAAARDRAFT_63678 [Jaapia argillacea MUCL 33604]|uniref:Uncharacterized protein n=1 Tax=Jaapia argillacea MUCL 33604 TaxID=933084 RepID=A0A067PGA7_9AGAM|nr:hypothetical protein JAAARDRAFT_63678 [Jaapia argillacea MUCL 33604]
MGQPTERDGHGVSGSGGLPGVRTGAECMLRWRSAVPGGRDGQDDAIPAGTALNVAEVATAQAKKLSSRRKTAWRMHNDPRYQELSEARISILFRTAPVRIGWGMGTALFY